MIEGHFEVSWVHHVMCAYYELPRQKCDCRPEGVTSREAYVTINREILPECVAHFESKQHDYAENKLLGAKGVFSDMNRKMGKLRMAVWEGMELEGESPQEIVRDFFGHVLMMLYCLQRGI